MTPDKVNEIKRMIDELSDADLEEISLYANSLLDAIDIDKGMRQ